MRSSVLRDFFEILNSMGLYNENHYNKTDKEYVLNGNIVEFVSLDQPQKKRGAKRHYLWLNEANEFTFEDYFQLSIRTSGLIVLDYNPSDEYSWIYDKVLTRNDCKFIQSTYKDNPFLEESLKREIEALEHTDENYWKIYGLGERGKAKAIIYDKWDIVDELPECEVYITGMDFGYNNPSAVIEIGVIGKDAYIDELLYSSKMTNTDLISALKYIDEFKEGDYFADSAEPDRIEEISRAGFHVRPARKGKQRIKDGIDTVKRYNLHITKRSDNVIKEFRNYKWREDKDGKVLEEPVKLFDHAMDAIRYALGEMELPKRVEVTRIPLWQQQKVGAY
jgi:phage terminase large subunit